MTKVTIPLSGISRNTDDSISQDGRCMELINARPYNGSIEPVGRPILEKQFTEGKSPVFLHKNGSYEHVISYFNNAVVFDCVRENGGYTTKNIAICSLPGMKQISSVGNILCMSTDESIYYAIFADGAYKYLGDKPDEPNLTFVYHDETGESIDDTIWCDIEPKLKLNGGNGVKTALNESSKSLVNDSFKSRFFQLVDKTHDAGKVIYPLLVRYAIRLFDGSYIMHSSPLFMGRDNYIFMSVVGNNISDGYLNDFSYRLIAKAGTIEVMYDLSGLKSWEGVASSVDIFMSKEVVVNDLENDIESVVNAGAAGIGILPVLKSNKDLINEISELSNFYLVKSIPIGSRITKYENLFSEGNAFRNLEQKTQLPDDAFTRNKITGGMYAYNGKLHVGNIKSKLSPFYPFKMFDTYGATGGKVLSSEIHIKTDNGLKIIHNSSVSSYFISPYISYPDSRAVKLVVYSGDKYKEFPLKPHPFLNIAYHFNQMEEYSVYDFPSGVYNELSEDNTEISPNKLKVSEISNPLYFPAKQTYVVSNRP